MLDKTANELLQEVDQKTESGVLPKFKNSFDRIILSGKKVMYDDTTHDMMVSKLGEDNPPEINVGEGVAELMGILWKEGNGTLPMQAFIPASIILLCEGMDFAEKAGEMQVTPDTLAAATKELMSSLMQILGITPEKIQAAKAQAGQAGQATPQPNSQATTTQTPQQQPADPKGIIGKAMGA